ncbi:unnamed protein product [Effrenium voratum]|uniref:MATH domain-containing protein n=1 Tax=Effrenium voratum TaxID=2562239 RepID=A0AA36ML48_9DINO|nr:unnamed protein product [Effrenium voratum]
MPKPVYATADELADAVKKLEGQLKATEAKLGAALKQAENGLKGELGKVSETVTNNATVAQEGTQRCGADSKGYTDDRLQQFRAELTGLVKSTEESLTQADTNLSQKMDQVDTDVRKALADELAALCERIDKEFTSTRADMTKFAETKSQEGKEKLQDQRDELDRAMATAAQEAQANMDKLQAAVEKTLKDTDEAHQKAQAERDEKTQRSDSEIWLKLDRLSELLQELTDSTTNATDNLREEANSSLSDFRNEATGRLDGLDEENLKMKTALMEVENIATRRVDWVIKDASRRLRPNSASKASLHTSWFSPKFDMAGVHGLQLELQLFRPSDWGADGECSGDIALFLWACKGMNLVFKLFCGGKSQTCEKVFNGKVPYGTTRFCWLKDQINREDDTLRIGCEILEAVREVEFICKPMQLPSEEELASATQAEKEHADKMAAKQLPGSLLFRRHVNNRLFDQVKGQVDAMRSRMVRRVEWRLEQAGMLRKCFPPGESMCSASFNAAGIEGMQLIFYPCGYNGATDGFCSLYLYAPAGATLRCNLFVGDQKRDANHTFEVAGAFGRTNFCRFEAGMDIIADSINIALEVDEAHQDMIATVAHPKVVPGDVRSVSQLDASVSGPIESTVKLQHSSGSLKKSLLERRVLPSLWTAKSLADKTRKEDNFHSFDELSKTRGNATRRGESSPLSPGLSEDLSLGELQAPLPKLKSSFSEKTSLTEYRSTNASEWSVGSRSRGRRSLGPKGGSQVVVSPISSPDL